MRIIDEIKTWIIARWLKRPQETILPRPQKPTKEVFDPPVFVDKFEERRSDPKFQEIDQKIMQAVANLKG